MILIFFGLLLFCSKVGDILNFFSAVFFGIHMLRTEQISRSTDKKKFLALLSFEVVWRYSHILRTAIYLIHCDVKLWTKNLLITRSLWSLSLLFSGVCSKTAMLILVNPALTLGLSVCFGIQQLHFLGYQHCTLEFFLRCYACGQRSVYFFECSSSFKAPLV
jgi:hypothetical protein